MMNAGFKPLTKANSLEVYKSDLAYVRFRKGEQKIYIEGLIDMNQLKAIYKRCEEKGWI